MKLVNPSPKYGKAEFTAPAPYGYLYLGARVDPPGRAPFVRRSRLRDHVLDEHRRIAGRLERHPAVVAVTVHRAVFMPPLAGAPRFDVLTLIRTSGPETLDQVRDTADYRALAEGNVAMSAYNVRRIGDTDAKRSGTFLFNHFTAPDPDDAVAVWEHLTGWYLRKTGVDNSALLRPIGEAPYAAVNQVRLPRGPLGFLLRQLATPSFHTYVRANLRANGMAALPVFYTAV